MSESQTDISDLTWNDLVEETEYSILRELASERDGVNGNGSAEEIAAGLLAHDGRADEIPDDYGDDGEPEGDEEEADDESDEPDDSDDEPVAETQVVEEESDDADESDEEPDADEPEEESDDDWQATGKVNDQKTEPRRDASFIIDASTLAAWLEPIDALVDECKIHLGEASIWTKAVDPANVGMVDARLESQDFDSFDVPSPGVIGVNTGRLDTVISGANADTLIHINYVAERRNLVVEYEGHEFTQALIDPDSIRQEPDLPDLDLPAKLVVESGDVSTAIGNADHVTDHVSMRAGPDDGGTFFIYGEGDTDSYEARFNDRDADAFDVTFQTYPNEEVLSLFSLDYLKKMAGAMGKGLDVTVRLGNEFPTHLIFDVDEEASGEVTYMLAPRIQSD